MPLTLEDVAKMVGVSRSTVSRVINNEPNVNDETRQKVEKVIKELNFQPNLAARGLAAGKSHILGFVIPVGVNAIFSDPFFPLLMQNVTSACNQKGYSIMLWLAEPEFERRTIHQVLYNGLVDGVIVSSMKLTDPIIESLSEHKFPFVTIGRNPIEGSSCYVDADNYNGAREAVMHLIRQGRKRIASITGPMDTIVGIDRFKGYQDSLKQYGISMHPELIVEGDFSDGSGYYQTQRLLEFNPDAIFAASDVMAIASIRAIQDSGHKVPDDIAVVGYDDIPLATRTTPTLTTIRQPFHRMGTVAVEILLDMIGHPSSQPHRIVLPTELVIRSSCGAVTAPA